MKTPINLLFLCTHNSARSIVGEALASTHKSGCFLGYSAGSMPGTEVNPFARAIALSLGYPEERLRSKSWDEYSLPDAPKMDCVITVCDNAASEVCPIWPGNPATAHWGLADPSQVRGTDSQKRQAFEVVMQTLQRRMDALAAQLSLETMDTVRLQKALQALSAL